VGVAALALQLAAAIIGPGDPGASYPGGASNPVLAPAQAQSIIATLGAIGQFLGGIALVASVFAVVTRFRRSVGVEREQLKWFASAALVVIVSLVGAVVFTGGGTALAVLAQACWFVMFAAIAFVPVAIGIAILRYRLYEIDRIVSRTISYLVVSAILVSAFASLILVLEAILAPVIGGQTIAVAGSTIAVVAIASPLLRRVRLVIDRRFNRAHYDAERTVAGFTVRLRDEVDAGRLRTEILSTITEAVEPRSLSLWLREPSRVR
jgi:hypothetical protein